MKSLPDDMLAKIDHIIKLIEKFGLNQIREPHVKHLEHKLWEMRVKGKDGIARILYVTVHQQRVVILHAFVKKTNKTPKRAIRVAMSRMKEIQK
ncbi:MAG: type II toxin-antitoxin system RelE/ParE family toxin [Magnetococcus sp. DMHC-1]